MADAMMAWRIAGMAKDLLRNPQPVPKDPDAAIELHLNGLQRLAAVLLILRALPDAEATLQDENILAALRAVLPGVAEPVTRGAVRDALAAARLENATVEIPRDTITALSNLYVDTAMFRDTSGGDLPLLFDKVRANNPELDLTPLHQTVRTIGQLCYELDQLR